MPVSPLLMVESEQSGVPRFEVPISACEAKLRFCALNTSRKRLVKLLVQVLNGN